MIEEEIVRSAEEIHVDQPAHWTAQRHPQSTINKKIYPVIEGISSIKTRKSYQRCFNHFLNHIKIHDLQVLLDFSQKVIKQMMVDYILYLRDEKKLSRATIIINLSAILHFFQINNDEFTLTLRNLRIHLPSDESVKEDRPYTIEEIGQVLNECDLRSKSIILLLCSSGMRMGALHLLQIGHLNHDNAGTKIIVYSGTKDKYFTFCTPECHLTIQNYLNYRKRCGERLDSKSPLIREQFNKDNPFTINTPRFLSERGIERIIDTDLRKSGIRKIGEVHVSHGFRKFFFSECEKSGMKSINVKMLMGHNIGVSGHYYRPSELDLLEDYMTHAANALTIDPNQRLQTRVKELEVAQSHEIAQLKADNAMFKERLQQAGFWDSCE